MEQYENGKIYKICSFKTDKIYIGSTCATLEKRLKEHVAGMCGSRITSYEIIVLGLYYI